MDCKTLGYDSLKTILQYMEANKRFQISQRIPYTRTADRVTPLFIDRLRFDEFDMTVNNTLYAVRTFIENWKSPNGTFRYMYEGVNGRFAYDLDKFGLANFSTKAEVAPGDLINEEGRRTDNAEHRETRIRYLERRIEYIRDDCRNNSKSLHVKGLLALLVPYYCSRNNWPLPYDLRVYLEFAHSTSDGDRQEERLSYNRTLPEAMKYLTNKLFANRKHPINVRRLENVNVWRYVTIRLPANLKMKVKELKVGEMSGATQLLPVIQNSMLEVFRLELPNRHDFNMETLKSTQLLILSCFLHDNWLPHARNLQNKQVLLLGATNRDVIARNSIRLIKHWIDNGKEVGSCFSFGLIADFVGKIKSEVMKEFGGLTLTMENQCKIVVSFEKISPERLREFYKQTWLMKMEVVE